MKPGDRVTWTNPHPQDVGELGTVLKPTPEDIAYAAREYGPRFAVDHFLVRWDTELSMDPAWHPPKHLRVVEDAA